jgi:hypothetical protein
MEKEGDHDHNSGSDSDPMEDELTVNISTFHIVIGYLKTITILRH